MPCLEDFILGLTTYICKDLIVSCSEDIDPDLLQYLASDAANADNKDDLLLAQMLQHEFDKEHDAMLAAEEKKFNGTSKGH